MKRFVWIYPEWWTLALSAAAWVVLVAQFLQTDATPHHHGEITEVWITNLSHWLLMVVAMMFPAVVGPVHGTAIRSLWRRRHRAIAGFLLGYVAVWMAAGIVVIATIARWRLDSAAAYVAAGFAAAALWQLTPVKRRALRACHRAMPLAPQGWRADMDCLRYGSAMGVYCLASCGVLMLACSLAGHSLPAMLGAAALGVVERYGPRVSERMILGAICSFAAVYMIASLP